MAPSGQPDPEPPEDGSAGRDWPALCDSTLYDSADLARQPDEALEIIMREIAPGAAHRTPAARAAQIEADRRLVAWVRAEQFRGPNTRKLLQAAFDYATPVVSRLISTGRIFNECARLNRPVQRQPGGDLLTAADRAFLTENCVDAGIFRMFYKYGLVQGRWDPSHGASLATYAVNACTLSFPPIYRDWWRALVLERSFGDMTADLPAHVQVDLRQPDPADQAADRVDAERLLLQIPQPERTALWLRGMHGETHAEAAAFVGLTGKALDGRLRRARDKLGLRDTAQKAGQQPAPNETGPELDAQEGDCDR